MTDLTTPAGDAVREKYRREGAQAERERIIELLETDCKNGSIEFAIALIKGEK